MSGPSKDQCIDWRWEEYVKVPEKLMEAICLLLFFFFLTRLIY